MAPIQSSDSGKEPDETDSSQDDSGKKASPVKSWFAKMVGNTAD